MAVRPLICWITGRPASGKTTLGRALVAALERRAMRAALVDSDEVRARITPHPTYAPEERAIVYRAIAFVARTLADNGIVAVVAATAHDPALRAAAREVAGDVFTVYARCPLAVCESRDPKGIYARGRASAAGTVPGVHVPFVEPTDADLVVDTDRPLDEAGVEAVLTAWFERSPARGP